MPYSARVSILVEIAEKADVSVEGVVRVLTREPVSDAIKERVLAVLDDLTPEQTRAVQRFALAALNDVLEQQGHVSDWPEPTAVPDENQLALPVASTGEEPEQLPTATSDAALVQLSSVLGELAEAVRDLRRETDAERRERVDDLAVLIDLITTGWQGLDTRLGRIERQVTRLESGRREPVVGSPARIVPTAIETPAVAPPAAPKPSLPPASSESSSRDRLPVVAALTLVGAGIVTLAVLQLASGGPDISRLVSARETTPAATTGLSATTGGPTSTPTKTRPAATQPAATTARRPPASTSEVLGTTSAGTTPSKPPSAPTTSPKTVSAPPATTARTGTTGATPPGFKPTRNWAWAPVKDATYYDVVFTRQGAAFYRGSPAEPRLTLPASVVFRPGAYRWVVRPGFGERAAKNLGAPVVDSPFTVS
jgi:Bacterial regulatory proteins, lacI family